MIAGDAMYTCERGVRDHEPSIGIYPCVYVCVCMCVNLFVPCALHFLLLCCTLYNNFLPIYIKGRVCFCLYLCMF